ncbi:hypothetical protein LCGC14_1149420 [marine sediment metagenome]|uniref:Uncharacterized protein n=1 Tax=marine sediment metagenome TaxID=412755 RepID=A0A0F9M0Y6_9ZZZZ
MSLEIHYHKFLKREFTKELHWFEEEFDLLFNCKSNFFKQDKRIANQILDVLSETINLYPNEKLLTRLAFTLNNIKEKHPVFFNSK